MGKINDNNFIVIQAWMVNELELKGNELLLFALIYGYSQDGVNRYKNSQQSMANWLSSSRECVRKTLNSLIEKELILKYELLNNNVKSCEYYFNANKVGYYPIKLVGDTNKVGRGIPTMLVGGSQESWHNNKDNNKSNKELIIKEINKESSNYFESSALNETFINFIQHRKKMNATMTDIAIKQVIKKLNSMSADENEKIEILNQSIINGWKGIFPLKKQRVEFKGITESDHKQIDVSKEELDKELEEIMKGRNK